MPDKRNNSAQATNALDLNKSDLRALIANRLQKLSINQLSAPKAAAVALIITESGLGAEVPGLPQHSGWQTEPAFLLTRRAKSLSKHAGQWALPGGRIDRYETAEQAARRESAEEINLTLLDDAYLGCLDDYVSRSGFVMSPMVYWPDNTDSMNPNPHEVASIHRIPFSELLRHDAPILDYNELDDSELRSTANHPVLRMPLGDHWIAAPTAAILYQFREVCLLDKQTRVAHFEQPKFTWR